MHFQSLTRAVKHDRIRQAKGPVAVIIAEDEVEVIATLRHHVDCGFATVILCAPAALELTMHADLEVLRIDVERQPGGGAPDIVNPIHKALPRGTWLYYGYNAEFLFYPFSEHRSVGELLAFHAEERREAMLTYVIDVYAADLDQAENAVNLSDAHLDRAGYYALARHGEEGAKERQLDFFGGLRWRFEEHIPWERRRIDRIALVRSDPDVSLNADHTWTKEEWNTYACPWHHNLTAAIVSFRTAKALRTNPASRFSIESFRWHNSIPFEWKSQQLLDLGFIEPGQWF